MSRPAPLRLARQAPPAAPASYDRSFTTDSTIAHSSAGPGGRSLGRVDQGSRFPAATGPLGQRRHRGQTRRRHEIGIVENRRDAVRDSQLPDAPAAQSDGTGKVPSSLVTGHSSVTTCQRDPPPRRIEAETAPLCSPDSLQVAVGILAPQRQERGSDQRVSDDHVGRWQRGAAIHLRTFGQSVRRRPGACTGPIAGGRARLFRRRRSGMQYRLVPAPDQARVSLPNGTNRESPVAAGPGVPIPSVCTTHASTLHVSPIVGSTRATYP